MSDAFRGGITVKRGDGRSPTETFTLLGEVYSMSGLGKTNALLDVTNFDSAGSREYISGLADGQEITIECNYLPANAQQSGLVDDVDDKTNRNLEIEITDGVTTKTFAFAVTPLSWVVNPAEEDKNTISYTLKISGAITVT